MKIKIVAGSVFVIALIAVFISQRVPSDPHKVWKRYAVETETKVRPARFEEMKFQPGVDVRAPASKESK